MSESEPRTARVSQAKWARPPRARHLRAQSCEDISGEMSHTTSSQGVSEPSVARMLRQALPHHLAHGIQKPRVATMSRAELARLPGAWHLGAQSCEDVSGETGRNTSRMATQSSEFGGCLRRHGPEHLSCGLSEHRTSRMSQAKRAGPPLAPHLGAQSCEDVSGETGWTTPRTASQSSELRGCLRRNGPEHLAHDN